MTGVWNALEKLAVHRPEVFADYYANDILALISAAWLGPNYQMTSDLNVVNPGGKAQTAHRDYHLGFMPLETAAGFPAHVHRLSPVLTLQGAVAHCDMPVRDRPDHVPAELAEVPARIPGHRLAGVRRVLRGQLRAAAAGEGRRGVLQPRTLPRRRHQPLRRCQADGEPAAGLVGVRSGAGNGEPDDGMHGALSDAARPQDRPARRRPSCDTSSRRRPRVTRSRPISTWISRSAASIRRPRPS